MTEQTAREETLQDEMKALEYNVQSLENTVSTLQKTLSGVISLNGDTIKELKAPERLPSILHSYNGSIVSSIQSLNIMVEHLQVQLGEYKLIY